MKKGLKGSSSEQLVSCIVNGIRGRKGKDITVLDLRKIQNAICDFYVICSGDSSTHVSAIGGGIEEYARKEMGEKPWHMEGLSNAEWVLVDYVSVVAHIFKKGVREFYDIEGLWADAELTEYEDQD
jgi:ribosome-associated protein